MKGFNSFLGFLSLETGIVFMVVFDILHFLYHLMIFLPKNGGRKVYIYYKAFDLDADLLLFYSTNIWLILIKIGYGIKVIQKKYKAYTNTYSVLTTLWNLLVAFLDFALSAYLAKSIANWYGFIYAFIYLLISIYFIMLTKALHKKVVREREAAKAGDNEAKEVPLIEDQSKSLEESDEDTEQEKDEDEFEESQEVAVKN